MSSFKCVYCKEDNELNHDVKNGDTVTCTKCNRKNRIGIPLSSEKIVALRSAKYIKNLGISKDEAIDRVFREAEEIDIKDYFERIKKGSKEPLKRAIERALNDIEYTEVNKSKSPRE